MGLPHKKSSALQIEDIAIGKNGDVWVATAEAGIFRFDTKTKSFKSYQSVIPSKKTTNIHLSKSGKLIVSSNDEGIYICDEQMMAVYQVKLKGKGESILHVNNIKDHGNDKVLLATNQGVYILYTETRKTEKKLASLVEEYTNLNVTDVYYSSEQGWFITTTGKGFFIVENDGTRHHYTEDIFQKTKNFPLMSSSILFLRIKSS